MSEIEQQLSDLVVASRILAHQGICDAFGHVSVRNPDNSRHFFLARAVAPELVTRDDVNAQLQAESMQMGAVKYLSDGEIRLIQARLGDAKPGEGYDRAWQYWARRAGVGPDVAVP